MKATTTATTDDNWVPPRPEGFAMVHDSVTFSNVPHGPFRFYVAIVSVQGAPGPGNKYRDAFGQHYFAELLGIKPDTVNTYEKILEDMRLIAVERPPNGKHRYRVLYNPAWTNEDGVQTHIARPVLDQPPVRHNATRRKAEAAGQPERAKGRTDAQKLSRNLADRQRRKRIAAVKAEANARSALASFGDALAGLSGHIGPDTATPPRGMRLSLLEGDGHPPEMVRVTPVEGGSLGLSTGYEGLGLSCRSSSAQDFAEEERTQNCGSCEISDDHGDYEPSATAVDWESGEVTEIPNTVREALDAIDSTPTVIEPSPPRRQRKTCQICQTVGCGGHE